MSECPVLGEKDWYSKEEVFPGFHAGHALRGARYREDVSQRQLAKLTGVSVQNISAMENGRRSIDKDMAKRFAKVLNTDWRLAGVITPDYEKERLAALEAEAAPLRDERAALRAERAGMG